MRTSNAFKYFFILLLSCCISLAAFAQRGADQININGEFVMAAKAGRIERVAALLTQGAAANSRDRNGDSPLNMAASKGNEALVDILLRAGADVNLANLAGVTPLMGAAFSGNASIVRKLIAASAKTDPVDRVKKNAAIYAAGVGCKECLSELLRAGAHFVVEPVAATDWLRIAELVWTYRDLRLGTVDASVVAAAERLGIVEVATLDRRHFSVVRPKHADRFELLP